MQSITPVTSDQLLAPGQEPLLKLEIYVGAAWVNLCDLDSKNYVEDISVSLGGASMTPNPIGGTWSVTLSNENSIFHPKHPTSAYKDYLVTGRKARLSIGGKYGGTDYYWQRIIGHMDEPRFSMPDFKVNISGADYMKFLQDTELRSPDNYWGASQTFDSIASTGEDGNELYNEADAMDKNNEANNVTNWDADAFVSFTSVADAGGGSTYVGRAIITQAGIRGVKNTNIFTPEANQEYKYRFKYKKGTGDKIMRVIIKQYISGEYKELAEKADLEETEWTEETIYFTAQSTDAIQIFIEFSSTENATEFRVDQFTIFKFIPYDERYYELPAASKGPYYVTLDGSPVWEGDGDEDWFHEESTKRVAFSINKTVSDGTNNLMIYYFTTQAIEDVLADLLVTAGLYANRAAALADMDYTDPAIDIDQVWFEAGNSALDAIRKICERCDYRFYFKYDGTPVFKPKPAPGSTAFTFTDQKHIASANNYQDRNEIRNRIVIEGKKQADPASKEETMPPELKGEAYDQTSIDDYGERTLTIKNHLFQDQTSIDNMCTSLLAEYKDPKLYADIEVPFNPVPLELADKISWKERLSPALEITRIGMGRDIKIDSFNTTYKCESLT